MNPAYRKILIPLPEADDPITGESVWAEVLEDEPDHYILRNQPCHPELFWGDVVHAVRVEGINPSYALHLLETPNAPWDEKKEGPRVFQRLTFQSLVRRDVEIWHSEADGFLQACRHDTRKEAELAKLDAPILVHTFTIGTYEEAEATFRAFVAAYEHRTRPSDPPRGTGEGEPIPDDG